MKLLGAACGNNTSLSPARSRAMSRDNKRAAERRRTDGRTGGLEDELLEERRRTKQKKKKYAQLHYTERQMISSSSADSIGIKLKSVISAQR